MIRKALAKSNINSIDKAELVSNINLFVKEDRAVATVEILESAFGNDSRLPFETLTERLQKMDFDSSLNVSVGTVLFFLGTELPEHGC